MFAPVGYLPLAEVYRRFQSASFEMRPHVDIFQTLGEDGEYPQSECQENLNTDAKKVFPYWGIWRLCLSPDIPTYLCSPTGIILRVSNSFFIFADGGIASIEHFMFPVIEGSELEGVIEDIHIDPITRYKATHHDDCFTVSFKTGQVRALNDMKSIAVQQLTTARKTSNFRVQQLLTALEAAGGPANGKPLDWTPSEERPIHEYIDEEMLIHASRFTGWSVCFFEDDIPEEDEDLLALVPFAQAFDSTAAKQTRTSSEIIAEIIEAYDSGKIVTRDVYKRKLAADMKEEEWRATWREATLQRPALSRRGPKSRKSEQL